MAHLLAQLLVRHRRTLPLIGLLVAITTLLMVSGISAQSPSPQAPRYFLPFLQADAATNAQAEFEQAEATPQAKPAAAGTAMFLPLLANQESGVQAAEVTPLPDLIFIDSFETGDFGAWSASATDGGDLSVRAEAAMVGNYGLQAVINDNRNISLTDDTPAAEPRLHARFYFDPNAIAMANGDAHMILYGYSATGVVLLGVEFRFYNGGYQLRGTLRNDHDQWRSTSWYTISDDRHFVEIEWFAAMAAGANDGYLTLWINDLQLTKLSSIDNDTHRLERVRIGALGGVDAATHGHYYFDAFESRRQTHIGAATAEPTPTVTPTPTLVLDTNTIFADDFEADAFARWSSHVVDGGDLSVNAEAALVGNGGMQALLGDNDAIYVTDDQPLAESRYRARFYFDPNSIPMASGNTHFILQAYSATAVPLLGVELRFYNGSYQLRAALRSDSSGWRSSGWYTIADAAHAIELDWQAATAAGASNGYLTLWIDNSQKVSLNAIDNAAQRVEWMRLGAVAGLDSGTRGRYYFDAFMSQRQSYIGPTSNPVLIAAGDIADCGTTGAAQTAALLDGFAGTVVALGDNAYFSGSLNNYRTCYEPTWGRHKARTRPAVGNHEYFTAGAAGYYTYFGAAASPLDTNCTANCRGYYSYDLGEWHIIVLNSEIAMAAGSAQEQWLREDLAAHPTQCTLAYWHTPRFSSNQHGNSTVSADVWRVLYQSGVDVVLNGHEHAYERFAPQNPDAVADLTHGIRQFIVGTGGTQLRSFVTVQPNSEVRNSTTWGVLKLELHPTSYMWEFIPVAGQLFTDSGSADCVGAPPAS